MRKQQGRGGALRVAARPHVLVPLAAVGRAAPRPADGADPGGLAGGGRAVARRARHLPIIHSIDMTAPLDRAQEGKGGRTSPRLYWSISTPGHTSTVALYTASFPQLTAAMYAAEAVRVYVLVLML